LTVFYWELKNKFLWGFVLLNPRDELPRDEAQGEGWVEQKMWDKKLRKIKQVIYAIRLTSIQNLYKGYTNVKQTISGTYNFRPQTS
jgi:hypothetical protein